jgi:heme exporter protein A
LTLELDQVELRRGNRSLIEGLSFSLEPGQLGLVTGANGSGKTTLLRAIAGLMRCERGEIRIQGRPAHALEPEERRQLAYQGHVDGLKKDLTAHENLIFYSGLRSNNDSISEILSELRLSGTEQKSTRHLSAGQRRRLALAVLKVAGASLWLLDEPLTNLDADGRGLVARWLDAHLAAGGSAVVATHLADELKRPGSLLVEL